MMDAFCKIDKEHTIPGEETSSREKNSFLFDNADTLAVFKGLETITGEIFNKSSGKCFSKVRELFKSIPDASQKVSNSLLPFLLF